MRTYLLFPVQRNAIENIKRFDREIQKLSEHLYKETNKDKFFKGIRLFNYSIIPVIRILYKIWCKRYE